MEFEEFITVGINISFYFNCIVKVYSPVIFFEIIADQLYILKDKVKHFFKANKYGFLKISSLRLHLLECFRHLIVDVGNPL